LATAAVKSGEPAPAPEDISRAAEKFVDIIQRTDEAATSTGGSVEKHVLWVDDRPDNNVYERRAFESMGFSFTLVVSTDDAMKSLSSKRFAAVISDMGRREGPREGYALLEKLRTTGDATPFFIYASSNAAKYKREAKERGAQGSTNDPQELFDLVMGSVTMSECRELVNHAVDMLGEGKYKQAYNVLKSAERKLSRFTNDNDDDDTDKRKILARIEQLKSLMESSAF
jgi:CheY-like chemotaxis protein